MKHSKKSASHSHSSDGSSFHAKVFAFFDKATGLRRFEVSADQRGRLPREEAVSLLAVHCITHHQVPTDFGVMIGIQKDLIGGLAGRVEKLIERCPLTASASAIRLTRRENEVLSGVTQDLSNKEIASRLNLTERTVKFHVSSLLRKFHVKRRVGLFLHSDIAWVRAAQPAKSEPHWPVQKQGGMAPALPLLMPTARGTTA